MFTTENTQLRWSWDRHPRKMLDTYLVSNLEDPRINLQSILTRSLITDSLWPGQFTNLIHAEMRFGTALSWIISQLQAGKSRDNVWCEIDEGKACPALIAETYRWLQSNQCPVIDYLTKALDYGPNGDNNQLLNEEALNTFMKIWRTALMGLDAETIRILEPACGSANDYRFIDQCGLAKFIDYTGIDISGKNIENAEIRYPDINFCIASILTSKIQTGAFDCVFVHDLFEHLSLDAIDQALTEVMRIARAEVWLHFFNAVNSDNHVSCRVDNYHWNRLSLGELKTRLEALGGMVEVIPISEFITEKFGPWNYHNPNAVTLLIRK